MAVASQVRYRREEIPGVSEMAQQLIDELGTAYVPRATRNRQQTLQRPHIGSRPAGTPTGQAYQQRQGGRCAPDTSQDEEIAPSTRPGRTRIQPSTPHYQQPPRKEWHPLVWVSFTLFGVWLFWIVTTVALSFWATHVTDPGTYGPTHGTVINVVLGGGDSETQPSKLIAINNGGRIEIMKLLANDPKKAQIITGPDLVKAGFPDPVNAEVSLSAGKGSVQVTIYGSFYDAPFHRYQTRYTLVEDGQGNLKSQQQ